MKRRETCYKLLTGTLMGLLLLVFSACTSSKESTVKVTADYLHVKGSLTTADGLAISGASVRIMDRDDSVTVSDINGQYKFTLSDSELTELAAAEQARLGELATGRFEVFFSLDGAGGQTQVGNFGGIDFNALGTVDTGAIVLQPEATLTGTILVLGSDGEFHPASGVTINSGPWSTTSGSTGVFSLAGLPSGKRFFYLTNNSDIALSRHEFAMNPGLPNVLQEPILVYPVDLVAGTLTAKPALGPSELLASGHPYRRTFQVNASPAAKYFKVSDDEQDFQFSSQSLATWRKVTDQVHFDFDGNGTHTLYYQFADEIPDEQTEQSLSPVQSVFAEVDIFADSGGIFLGDGSGVIYSRRVPVNISIPGAAVEMRLSETQTDFASAPGVPGLPWQEVKPAIEYILADNENLRPNQLRELFCQFRAADGTESSLYRYTAVLSVFPEKEDVFTIEGGAATTPKRLVNLQIDLPENAYEMKVYEEIITGGVQVGGVLVQVPTRQLITDTYIRAKANVDFVFLQAGRKTIFVQFRDRDGIESPVYKQDIQILPFDPSGVGFEINGGALASVERDLVIDLIPPERAIGYRISDDEDEISSGTFSLLRDQIQFRTERIGLNTIYVQYQNIDGEPSFIYSQDIFIDPFVGDRGYFEINNNAAFATSPLLLLQIQPPTAAVEMSVTEVNSVSCDSGGGGGGGGGGGQGFSFSTPGFIAVDSILEAPVQGFGFKTLCVRFRTITGETSPFLQQTIYLDPFPLAPEFEINGGSLLTFSPTVHLEFFGAPPAHAQDILLSVTGPSGNGQLLESGLQANYPINLVAPEPLNPFGVWKIEARFVDADGNQGRVFSQVIEYRLPPGDLALTETVPGNPATLDKTDVRMEISLPPEAEYYAVVLDGTDPTGLFQIAPPAGVFNDILSFETAPADETLHAVRLYYRTTDGEIWGPITQRFQYDIP